MTYNKNCSQHWDGYQHVPDACSYYDHFIVYVDFNWYIYILWPSVIIIFVTEFFIRTIIKRNHVIYPILNTFFLSLLPLLLIAYLVDNF